MHIDLWADTTCPWCYLGVRHLRAALADFPHRADVTVTLHAWFNDPELDDTPGVDHAHWLADHLGTDILTVRDHEQRLRDLGRAEGVVFDFDALVVAPASHAQRAVAAARHLDDETGATGPDTAQLRLFEAIARSHFEMGLDVSDPEVLLGCAQDVGVDPALVLHAVTDVTAGDEVFSDFQIGAQMGIDAVPTFLFDNRFVVQGMQPVTAMRNILDTAWAQAHAGKDNR